MVDPPATSHSVHPCVTCLAHANSVTVYTAGQETHGHIPPPQPLIFHGFATQAPQNQTPQYADMHTPPAFVPPGHQPIGPQVHQGEGVVLLTWSPRNGLSDPWSSEYAHAIPWDERLAVVEDTLRELEPLLDIPTMGRPVNNNI